MSRAIRWLRASAALGLAAWVGHVGALGCVPPDTTPERGAVYITVVPHGDIGRPLPVFADGWTVTINRIVGVMTDDVHPAGGASDGDDPPCSTQSTGEEAYGMFDFAFGGQLRDPGHVPADACIVDPRFVGGGWAGSGLPPLGPNVTPADTKAFYDEIADDPQVLSGNRGASNLRVQGHATLGAVSKRFDLWLIAGIDVDPGNDAPIVVTIPNGDKVDLTLAIDASQLFAVDGRAAAPRRFSAFALADDLGDGDGVISTQELREVDLFDNAPFEYLKYAFPYPQMDFDLFLGAQMAGAFRRQ